MSYLVLENGVTFEGERFGADGTAKGELVFTTGVVGIAPTLSDPCFKGQLVVGTFPEGGNYGIAGEDLESEHSAAGFIVRGVCDEPSNFRSQQSLSEFMRERGIVGLYGIDTRELTRILREEGTMNAIICDNLSDADFMSEQTDKNLVETVSQKKEYTLSPAAPSYRVVLIDYGVRRSTVDALCTLGCEVTVVPACTCAEDVLARTPDGVILSEGPGDPAVNQKCIEQIKKLIGNVPVLGLGLGHQMAALSQGALCEKLPFGHRGANQPVKADGRTYITSQNHSYAVKESSLSNGKVFLKNANDGSCEGIIYTDKNCITLQFTPDLHDTVHLYKEFIAMMGGNADA